MKNLIFLSFIILSLNEFNSSAQCSFQYISNDTTFQDYIEFIYPKKNSEEIITIGTRIARGSTNDTVFNAPVFQLFDYCGILLKKIIFYRIDNYKLKHQALPTHNSYKEEPVGNTAITINNDEFLLVDKAFDTISKKQFLILLKINSKGELLNYKTLSLTIQEVNQNGIKNVLKLKDGKFLIILWDNFFGYFFYYFSEKLDFLYKKSFSLGRGIRSLIETDNDEFVCTSLASDITSFQFYKLDTTGEIKWITTPYTMYGSAREILLKDDKIYITGGVPGFGVFLISDFEGNILKEFKYDTFFCQQRFCSAFIDSNNNFIIAGYIKHCELIDKRSYDIAILKIDTNGTILWNKEYDFKNELGTSNEGGEYTDYGGFTLAQANDGGFITNGISKYADLIPGKVLHEDALLIKTTDNITAIKNVHIHGNILEYKLIGNLLYSNLDINGPIESILDWQISSLEGILVREGKKWHGQLDISAISNGIYNIKISDINHKKYLFKFIKI